MKTPGQKLYEHHNSRPDRHGSRMPGWSFLSDKSREVWEKHAVGHPIFCEKNPNRLKNGVNTRSTGYPEVWVNR